MLLCNFLLNRFFLDEWLIYCLNRLLHMSSRFLLFLNHSLDDG